LSSKLETIRDTNNGSMTKLQRQSRMFNSRTFPLILEEAMLMLIRPTQDGINSGNIKENTS
jgi:hypothetical protein